MKKEEVMDCWEPTLIPRPILEAARRLRQQMTDAEQLLWQCLRGKQLNGFKFRKQHPCLHYVLDFYCPAAKLAIELDGAQHYTPQGKIQDAQRSDVLREQGIRVVRFSNTEVLQNIENVLQKILMLLLQDIKVK